MRIGICTGIDNIAKMQEIGFDYIETGLAAVGGLSPEDFEKAKRQVDASAIKVEAFNVFFPGTVKLVGPEANSAAIREYVKRVLERAALLGGKITVVGSGGARKVPEGWDLKRGLEQFAEALHIIGEEAEPYGIVAAIEPLNKAETNIVNTVREGIELTKRVNHNNVKLLADLYHMWRESEDMDSIIEAGNIIRHLHISSSKRVYPMDKNEDDYTSFFDALNKIGYDGRVSIEAGTKDIEADAPVALKVLRELCK